MRCQALDVHEFLLRPNYGCDSDRLDAVAEPQDVFRTVLAADGHADEAGSGCVYNGL